MTGVPQPRHGGRAVEVRPSWSVAEWAQVDAAASAAGMLPASWCTAVLAAAAETGDGPRRCTPRQLLWHQVRTDWETVGWAVVARPGGVADEVWDLLAERVRRGGTLLAAEEAAVTAREQAQLREAVQVSRALVHRLGPGTRRSTSARAAAAGETSRRHRAKVLLDEPTHTALAQTAAAESWRVSDYAGAMTASVAVLATADSRAAAEVAILRRCVDVVTGAARQAATMLGAGRRSPVEPPAWDDVAQRIAEAQTLIDQARATRLHDSAQFDLRHLLPDVFVVLGWPTPWPAPDPEPESVS